MRELAFVGLSDDGTSLVLSSSDGTRYVVPVDERLEATMRRDRTRLGQQEIPLDGTTPKDIQQRVRYGQTPEEIAETSGMPLERVLRFAGPVVAERQHIAAQAQAVELRDAGRSQSLEATVLDALALGGVDTDLVEWDAWRRDEARWSLLVSWDPEDSVAAGATAALFSYDPVDRVVLADDPASAWLLGERPDQVELEDARPYLVGLPSADDEAEVWEDDSVDPDAALTAIVERDSGAEVVDLMDRPPVEPDDVAPLEDLYDTLPGLARPEAKVSRRARRKASKQAPAAGDMEKGSKPRASVPSWDEILFGTRTPES